jgi:hypothetical protein
LPHACWANGLPLCCIRSHPYPFLYWLLLITKGQNVPLKWIKVSVTSNGMTLYHKLLACDTLRNTQHGPVVAWSCSNLPKMAVLMSKHGEH